MANDPRQVPNISLPGAEYLSLAQGHGIDIERRGALFVISPPSIVSPDLAGQANVTLVLDHQFTTGKGVYLRDARLTFRPVDNAGELEITGIQMNLGTTPLNGFYSLGFPLLTLLSPTVESVAAVQSDFLLTANDANQLLGATGQGSTRPPVPLSLNGLIFVQNNDPSATHTFSASIQCIWHVLSGILQ